MRRIQAPPGEKEEIIRKVAKEAVEITHRRDAKLARVMWKEIRRCYPYITEDDSPSCL